MGKPKKYQKPFVDKSIINSIDMFSKPTTNASEPVRRYIYRLIKGYLGKTRGYYIEWSLDLQFLAELFQNQNGLCAISNEPLRFDALNDKQTTASLDRIDSKKGYVKDNVWWVHKNVNYIKRGMSVEELKFWCCKIAEASQSDTKPQDTSFLDCKLDNYPQDLISTGKAAKILGMSIQGVVNMVERGEIECFTFSNGHRRLSRKTVLEAAGF